MKGRIHSASRSGVLKALLAWLALPCLASAEEEAPRAVPVEEAPAVVMPDFSGVNRLTSRSEQFRIAGGEGIYRGSIALLAEETKSELLQLIEEKDDWRRTGGGVIITITLHGRQGDPLPSRTSAFKLIHSEAGYEILLDLHMGRGIEQEAVKRVITSALIYERALRGKKPELEESPLLAPPWLVEGLREAVAWQTGTGDRRLYEGLFKHGGVFKLDEIFAVDERERENMDAATRSAFRVSSGALVMALVEQPQGKAGFRSFLNEAAAFEGETPALLRKHFPELNLSQTSLAKWWALQLANKGTAVLTEVMSIQETERSLAETLRLSLRDSEGIPSQKDLAESWQELASLKAPQRAEAVRIAQDGLVRLSYRCFPSYRPILAEYQLILTALIQNKAEKMQDRLNDLAQSRATLAGKAGRARDFLDWFEITRARETSGAFDDYLRLKDGLKYRSFERKDELSKYLDRMDVIFSRGQSPSPRSSSAVSLPPAGPLPSGDLSGLPPLPE